MSSRNKSISQRIRTAGSAELRSEIYNEWAKHWASNQMAIIARMDRARENKDWDQIAGNLAQLHALSVKMFSALPNVLSLLNDNGDL